jgi:two-component system invasion response regulator UvrY
MSTINVAIAEDQSLLRTGLANVINSFEGMKVCLLSSSGNDLLKNKKVLDSVDIVLVDLDMPFLNGFDTIKQINYTTQLQCKVVGITSDLLAQDVLHVFELGAKTVLSKDIDENELEKALQSVINEGYYLSDQLSQHLIKGLEQRYQRRSTGQKGLYTEQERFILIRLCQGKKAGEIAEELSRSVRTIENIKAGMMEKAEVQKTVSLVVHAIKHGIIELNDLD